MRNRISIVSILLAAVAAANLLLLGLVAFFALSLDQWCGASASPLFYAWALPAGVIPGFLAGDLLRRRVLAVALPAAYVLFIGSFLLIDTGPVKPGLRALRDARPGMSYAEVRKVVAGHFPPGGRFRVPLECSPGEQTGGEDLCYVLDSNDPLWNAALLRFRFQSGHLVGSEFDPD
jgi:hypothetical protein